MCEYVRCYECKCWLVVGKDKGNVRGKTQPVKSGGHVGYCVRRPPYTVTLVDDSTIIPGTVWPITEATEGCFDGVLVEGKG